MTLPSTARETDASSSSAQDDTKTEETVEDPTETVWKKPEPIEEEWPPIACSSGSAKTASSEAFCDCFKNNKEPKDCRCGEEDSGKSMFFSLSYYNKVITWRNMDNSCQDKSCIISGQLVS